MAERDACGSPQCLVDRLEETVTKQHAESMAFIREIFSTHISTITREIEKLERTIKDQGDDLFGRMRNVEGRLGVVETRWQESDELETVRSLRVWVGRVLSGVAIAAIIAAAGYFLFIYDTHGRANNYPQATHQVEK